MPTSLLLLSIQVSAALNLEEELLVTFCRVEDGVSSARGWNITVTLESFSCVSHTPRTATGREGNGVRRAGSRGEAQQGSNAGLRQ